MASCVGCNESDGEYSLDCGSHLICRDCFSKRPEWLKKKTCTVCKAKEKSQQSRDKRDQSQQAVKGTKQAVKKEEPAVKKEEPAVKKEEPAVKKAEPAVKKEESAVKKEEPAVKKEEPHAPIWIYVDYFNLWIGAKNTAAQKKDPTTTDEDPNVRMNIDKFIEVVAKGRPLAQGTINIYASIPPEKDKDEAWEKMEKNQRVNLILRRRSEWTKKEKIIDTQIVADITETVCIEKKKSTIVLVTGDADAKPAIDKALEYDWEVEVMSWQKQISNDLKNFSNPKHSWEILDDVLDKITFTIMEAGKADPNIATRNNEELRGKNEHKKESTIKLNNWKTQLCKYYLQNTCKKEKKDCSFAHGKDDVRCAKCNNFKGHYTKDCPAQKKH